MDNMNADPAPEDPKDPGTLDKTKLAALGAVLATAITIAVIVTPSPPTKLDDNGIVIIDPGDDAGIEIDAGPQPAQVDVAKYNREIKTYRAQHPGTVDLLSAPVEPGASVTVGVNVELGKRAIDTQ